MALVDNLVFVTLLSVSWFYCLPCVILQQVLCTMINKVYLILSYVSHINQFEGFEEFEI